MCPASCLPSTTLCPCRSMARRTGFATRLGDVLAEWTLGSHVLLRRNGAYWRDAETGVDQVRYLHLADRGSELSRYRAGELHMTYAVPVNRYFWLQENMADVLRVSPHLAVYFYGFNTRKPPLDDPRVRRALTLAADRELLTARVIGTGEAPACGFVPPGIEGYPGAKLNGCGAERSRRRNGRPSTSPRSSLPTSLAHCRRHWTKARRRSRPLARPPSRGGCMTRARSRS